MKERRRNKLPSNQFLSSWQTNSSSVKVHGQAKISLDLWLLLKLCLTLVQSLVNFCKITFTQLSLKVSIVVYTVKINAWPTKILPWLLTFALTEDEDQSTGYIGVPPLCPCPLVLVSLTSDRWIRLTHHMGVARHKISGGPLKAMAIKSIITFGYTNSVQSTFLLGG